MNKLPIIMSKLTVMLATLAIALLSCSSGSNDEPAPSTEATITVAPQQIAAECDATTIELNVNSTGDWSIRPEDDWCTVAPSGGVKNQTTTVKVNISANKGADARATNLVIRSGSKSVSVPVSQTPSPTLTASTKTVNFGAKASDAAITIEGNLDWTARSDASWCTVTPESGEAGTTSINIAAQENTSASSRTATVTVAAQGISIDIKVQQYSDEIVIPEGYVLVWNDEFNTEDGTQPDTKNWWYEDWAPGFVNNELQRYVPGGKLGNEKTAEIQGGILNITAKKVGNEVISARLNTSELWTYGYFEARIKLPKGKGTWPAFWMMPANGNNWPHCGEIDIMEEVGVNPNYTSSSIHCSAYNHTIGTQKTAEVYTKGAEDEFHVYALEWTKDYIRTYVDGKLLLSFSNDNKGDENTWPFSKPFHPILNLAWGGSWGGMNGVDESALPATLQVDYVRVFQKQ